MDFNKIIEQWGKFVEEVQEQFKQDNKSRVYVSEPIDKNLTIPRFLTWLSNQKKEQ